VRLYYINLDRSTARREWFERGASRLGVEFTRIAAVEGATVPESLAERLRDLSSAPLSAGEIGCLLSHRTIWKIVAEGGEEWAFIAEDDVHFSADARPFLTSSEWIPAGVEAVKAETFVNRVELSRHICATPFGHALHRLKSAHLGSGGYFVSRQAALRLLDFTEKHCEPVDQILFSPKLGVLRKARILQLSPAICIQDIFVEAHSGSEALASTIETRRRDGWDETKRRTPGEKLSRELWRVGRQVKGALRLAMTIGSGRSIMRKIAVAPLFAPREDP
jgi:glycosyl transferase family 25